MGAAQNVRFSAILQSRDLDLVQAVSEAKAVVSQLQEKRDIDAELDSICDRAVVEVIPCVLRGASVQQHRVNIPSTTPNQYWKRILSLSFIDNLFQDRLTKNEDRFPAQHIVHSMIHCLTDDVTNALYDTFRSDLADSSLDEFKLEVR